MKKVAVIILCALFALPTATNAHTRSPRTAAINGCPRLFHQKEFARHARKVFNHRPSITRPVKKRLKVKRDCAFSPQAVTNNRALYVKLKKKRIKRLTVNYTAPYSCGSSGHYAIPCYIVACESGFSSTAQNPSGAYGYYQLMPSWWGHLGRKPTPAEQHAIAAKLWNGGSGAGNWVCA